MEELKALFELKPHPMIQLIITLQNHTKQKQTHPDERGTNTLANKMCGAM